jgi:pimeloyl-ACP methyl ester carboxylesterase
LETVTHRGAARVAVNGVEIVYDTFGESSAPPLLLIQGLGMPMIGWDEEFCEALAGRGYWVIRFDNRDAGLSTQFDSAGAPDVRALSQGMARGEGIQAPYTLDDMADDALGLVDVLNVASGHVVGVSMGGMIAQVMAIRHPERVRTLTSIMSSTGAGGPPRPKAEAQWILFTPTPTERDAYIEHSVRVWRMLNGSGFSFDENRARARAGRIFERGLNPAGTARQLVAIWASGSRKAALNSLTVPTLVIHGDADPLIPVEYGIDTANSIPGAELVIVKGMGHSLPPVAVPQIIDAVARHACRVDAVQK